MAQAESAHLEELERRLGYRFTDSGLLRQALVHPSYAAEQKQPLPTNQRLEFLGDAVLQLALSALLFRRFPDEPEGRLTVLRTALCNERTLARIAADLGLGEFVLLGRGEDQAGGRQRPSILSDTLEAVLAAVFLDGGYEAAVDCCRRWFLEELERGEALVLEINPKGALQEWSQAHYHKTPEYEVERVTGPDHAPVFEVVVRLRGQELGRAKAGSRREAEKQAAKAALERLDDELPL